MCCNKKIVNCWNMFHIHKRKKNHSSATTQVNVRTALMNWWTLLVFYIAERRDYFCSRKQREKIISTLLFDLCDCSPRLRLVLQTSNSPKSLSIYANREKRIHPGSTWKPDFLGFGRHFHLKSSLLAQVTILLV